ncbi:sensor domain-containing diguanylate cyclase [Aliidiomarina halalkaliphila]|uniref:diguanylate cyclase n=1 Tax=Aliidiomarina halalkaliphila TaxID=2593535 RepID=A0A552X394_9GAMM|nr:sensor domain-containing diguanylate cyclase [Aliidiomarina halalkaliphila]TRW49359.1 sensor domain-containing diguanylate cyclase [Aliidiomarina halalkaliphila]
MGRQLPNSAELIAVLDALPLAVFYTIPASNAQSSPVVHANQTALEMFGLFDDGDIANQLEHLAFTVDRELISLPREVSPLMSPIIAGLSGDHVERRDLIFNGLPLNVQSASVHMKEGTGFLVTIQPRDHRLFRHQGQHADLLTSEISLRDLISFDKLISELSTKLINAQGDEAEQHIQQALAALGEFCQSDRTYVFLFEYDMSAMSNTHEWVREGITSHVDDLQNVPSEGLPWFFERIQEEGLFVIHDTSKIPEEGAAERAEFEREDIRSMLCVAMYAANEMIGFVGCDMVARERHWSEADIRRFKLVGEMIANAIQSQRFYQSLHTSQQQLIAANDALRELALRDGLTGLANRRQFSERLEEEISRSRRQDFALTVAMFDIDHFRKYNDHYGLQAGDGLLRRIADILQSHFRRHGELVSRYDGARFSVLIPHVEYTMAKKRVASFLQLLNELAIEHKDSPQGFVSMSAGIAEVTDKLTADDAISEAENNLGQAKRDGRNQVFPRIENK